MKSTGIVRRIDELGRIVLPIEIRRNLSIYEHDAVEIHTDGDMIILAKHPGTDCEVCQNGTIKVDDSRFCRNCARPLDKARYVGGNVNG